MPGLTAATHRNRREIVALVLVLAIATFLRFHNLASAPPGLYHDEAIDGNNCLQNIESHSLAVVYPENGGREGFYIGVATFPVYLFGNSSWALRLPAALMGVLTVFGVYLVAGELCARPVGLLASFFVATSFWHMVFSRLALRAIGAPLFLTFGLYLLLVGLRRIREERSSIVTMVAAGAVYGLGFYTYIAYRATPVLLALVLAHGFRLLRREGRAAAFWRPFAAFGIAPVLATMPLAIYFASHPGTLSGRVEQLSVAHNPHPALEVVLNTWRTARMFFMRGDRNWRHNYAYRAELFWPVAIFFAAGIVISIAALLRSREGGQSRFSPGLLLVWMAAGAAPAILSDDSLPHALRSILLVPPTFILAATSALWLWRRTAGRFPRTLSASFAALLCAVLVFEPYRTYFQAWAPRAEVARAMDSDAAEIARKISSLPRTATKYVAVTGADELPANIATVQYLTRSYTKSQREGSNIHYISRSNFQAPAGDFCQAVKAVLPEGSAVFCLEYRRGI